LNFKHILGSNEGDSEPYIQWYDSDSPNVSDYIKKRLEPQLKWYDNRSRISMYRYHGLQLLTIFFGVIIPVINIVDIPNNDFIIRLTSAILGSIIVGIIGHKFCRNCSVELDPDDTRRSRQNSVRENLQQSTHTQA
jgi:hypothetical protein